MAHEASKEVARKVRELGNEYPEEAALVIDAHAASVTAEWKNNHDEQVRRKHEAQRLLREALTRAEKAERRAELAVKALKAISDAENDVSEGPHGTLLRISVIAGDAIEADAAVEGEAAQRPDKRNHAPLRGFQAGDGTAAR